MIFATNQEGSFFGDIDFTNCDEASESKRLFSVKALTDMDLLFLEKSTLYDIDIDFKKEVFHLFSRSYLHRSKLEQMSRKSGAWLKRQFDTYEKDQFANIEFDE